MVSGGQRQCCQIGPDSPQNLATLAAARLADGGRAFPLPPVRRFSMAVETTRVHRRAAAHCPHECVGSAFRCPPCSRARSRAAVSAASAAAAAAAAPPLRLRRRHHHHCDVLQQSCNWEECVECVWRSGGGCQQRASNQLHMPSPEPAGGGRGGSRLGGNKNTH